MTTTANLKMELEPTSNFVSPNTFNKNFQILDALGIDYIVEKGTSGEWWYRKWNSGRAECGIDDKAFANQDHKTSWGSMYTTNNMSFGAYPFSFASRPFATITFNSDSSGSHKSYISIASTTSTTQAPQFSLVDPNSGTVNSPHFGIYVCGRYK